MLSGHLVTSPLQMFSGPPSDVSLYGHSQSLHLETSPSPDVLRAPSDLPSPDVLRAPSDVSLYGHSQSLHLETSPIQIFPGHLVTSHSSGVLRAEFLMAPSDVPSPDVIRAPSDVPIPRCPHGIL